MAARFRALAASLILFVPSALVAQATNSDIRRDLERLSKGEGISDLPSADGVEPGAVQVPSGVTTRRTIVARGPIDIAGTVEGSVVSLGGDVTIRAGGIVTGDALSVGGRVLADSGMVQGEIRAMSALPRVTGASAVVAVPRTPSQRTVEAVKIVAGTFGILLVVAMGVLLFAARNLDEVVRTLEARFSRAFFVGVLGQLVLLPALVVLIVALAVSLIGILLIPFAIVAYAIAAAGLFTLGFLAVARLVGGAAWSGSGSTERARAMGALAVGIGLFFALWMIAALMTWSPLAATVIRAAALAATWAAMTLGLGAAILSRAGNHRRLAQPVRALELAAWQTPTPVAGVVAARRPVALSREAR